jgi:hypothetical protein
VFRFLLSCFNAIAIQITAVAQTPEKIANEILAPLLDPAKVATLKGDRPANTRLYKILYWIEKAQRAGGDAATVIDTAQVKAGYGASIAAKADKQAILWSFKNLDAWGCFDDKGMEKLRKGGSPIITKGESVGDSIAIDHVLPRSIVPELAARFYNLEAIPAKKNLLKSAKITEREVNLARRWHREKLLSLNGLRAVETSLIIP